MLKPAHLRLLGRFGLLAPAFRVKERMRSLGGKGGGVGPDGLPLPPPKLFIRVTGTTETSWFIEGGRLTEESIRAALARAGAPLEFEAGNPRLRLRVRARAAPLAQPRCTDLRH